MCFSHAEGENVTGAVDRRAGTRDGDPADYLNRNVSRFFGANVRML